MMNSFENLEAFTNFEFWVQSSEFQEMWLMYHKHLNIAKTPGCQKQATENSTHENSTHENSTQENSTQKTQHI